MYYARDSFTIVLLGDWNNFYMQPGWIAENVFEDQEMEIGVNGQGTDYAVSYKHGNIIIGPAQNQMLFSILDSTPNDLKALINCVNNFTKKSYTPFVFAYGFNCDFYGDEGSIFAEVVDNMMDNKAIIESEYEIQMCKVSRTLSKGENTIIFDSILEDKEVKMHFNQHYGETLKGEEMPTLTYDQAKEFLDSCNEIIRNLGYEIEEDE